MTDEQPKSQSKKLVNPVEGSAAVAPEMSLDFSRPPVLISKAGRERAVADEGEFSDEEPLQALQQVTSIKYRSIDHPNHKLRMVLGVGALVILVLVLFLALPYYLIHNDRAINQAAKNSINFLQKNLEKRGLGSRTKVYADAMIQSLKMVDNPGSASAALKTWKEMDCKFLIQEALSRRFRGALEPVGQYYLTNCQMAQDLPQGALRLISENYGDAVQFQRNGDSWEMLPLQLLAGEAQKRLQTFHPSAPKNFANCRRWGFAPACFLKYMDQARQPVRSRFDDAYAVLKPGMKSQSPVLQVWLALATSWNYMKLNDGQQVELILKEAAGNFPELYDPFLEREIFRLRLMNAYRLRDKKLSAAVWKQRPVALMTEDEAGFWDAQLIRSVTQKPERNLAAIDEFLSHPESYQRFRFDPSFIRLVIEYGIRTRRAVEVLSYVDRISEQQDEEKTADNEWLPMLRTRLLLAQENGLEALQTLQPIEKFVARSPELAHLKGTAMLMAYATRPYRLLAAAEFQKAANIDPRGEHFFGLVLSFLDTRDTVKAEAAYKYWAKLKVRPADEPWRSLAQGLILYSQGNEAEAGQIWNELAQRNPGFDTVKNLITNLKEDPKYLQDQMVTKVMSLLPIDGPLSPLAVFL